MCVSLNSNLNLTVEEEAERRGAASGTHMPRFRFKFHFRFPDNCTHSHTSPFCVEFSPPPLPNKTVSLSFGRCFLDFSLFLALVLPPKMSPATGFGNLASWVAETHSPNSSFPEREREREKTKIKKMKERYIDATYCGWKCCPPSAALNAALLPPSPCPPPSATLPPSICSVYLPPPASGMSTWLIHTPCAVCF